MLWGKTVSHNKQSSRQITDREQRPYPRTKTPHIQLVVLNRQINVRWYYANGTLLTLMVIRKWVFIVKLWIHMQNTYNTTESPIKKSSICLYERKKALWTYETICKIHDIEHSWESNKDEFYLLTWAEEVSFCVWNNMKNFYMKYLWKYN